MAPEICAEEETEFEIKLRALEDEGDDSQPTSVWAFGLEFEFLETLKPPRPSDPVS